MVRHKELVEGVGRRLAPEAERTRQAVARTVYGLLPWLPAAERAALPAGFGALLEPPGGGQR